MAALVMGFAGAALATAAGPAMVTLAGSLGMSASGLGFFVGSSVGQTIFSQVRIDATECAIADELGSRNDDSQRSD